MSSLSRNQEFKYQYKMISVSKTLFCGDGPRLYVSVPENILDIKAVSMRAVFKFDASVPVDRRKILWAGGSFPYITSGAQTTPDPANGNIIEVNVQADPVTRIADMTLDMTHLKDKLLQAIIDNQSHSFEQPKMFLNIITDIGNNSVQGEVILWKIDFAYTTTGIQ